MNLNEFKSWIKTVSVETLDSTFNEIFVKYNNARNPAIIEGYAIALDELILEKDFRRAGFGPITAADREMSLEDILSELSE